MLADNILECGVTVDKLCVLIQDSLMSGMQDVSTLAEKYHSLADHSQNLQTIVQRMKRDVSDHDFVLSVVICTQRSLSSTVSGFLQLN